DTLATPARREDELVRQLPRRRGGDGKVLLEHDAVVVAIDGVAGVGSVTARADETGHGSTFSGLWACVGFSIFDFRFSIYPDPAFPLIENRHPKIENPLPFAPSFSALAPPATGTSARRGRARCGRRLATPGSSAPARR